MTRRLAALFLLAPLGLGLASGCAESESGPPAEIVQMSGRLSLCDHWQDGRFVGPPGSPLVQRVADECAAARSELASLRLRYAAQPELLEPLRSFAER